MQMGCLGNKGCDYVCEMFSIEENTFFANWMIFIKFRLTKSLEQSFIIGIVISMCISMCN